MKSKLQQLRDIIVNDEEWAIDYILKYPPEFFDQFDTYYQGINYLKLEEFKLKKEQALGEIEQ